MLVVVTVVAVLISDEDSGVILCVFCLRISQDYVHSHVKVGLMTLKIPKCMWKNIAMDFVVGLLKPIRGNHAIC